MKLTEKNYYSEKANKEYFSVSQFKDFMRCEAMAMAKISEEFKYQKTESLLVGSYVDSYFEGTLETFKEENPEIFTQKGALRAEYKKAEIVIERIEQDELFMKFMSGEKQTIFTFKMFGAKWKIKLDSYLKGIMISDLKIMKDFKGIGRYRYDLQGAVYQEGVRIKTKEKLPFYLNIATKEDTPNLDIFQIPDDLLESALEEVKMFMPRFISVKNGTEKAESCGICDYCKQVKKATVRSFVELLY